MRTSLKLGALVMCAAFLSSGALAEAPARAQTQERTEIEELKELVRSLEDSIDDLNQKIDYLTHQIDAMMSAPQAPSL